MNTDDAVPQDAVPAVNAAESAPPAEVHTAQFAALTPLVGGAPSLKLPPLMDVSLKVSVLLGETTMSLGELLKTGPGSVLELNRSTGEPVDILVNVRLYAKGEVVVVEESFGVRLLELIEPQREKAA